ncbi:ATP binding [Ascochyta rabiei]|uniref:ATP binding n=1 Tax=Didymella rabiei TaxID=5454 RepID=A0A162WCR2_DIDRA|nr:ATP binding [Ascochyta rabiei]
MQKPNTDPTGGRAETKRASRPRADLFCVYNTSTQSADNRVAAYIVEYKAPHKLPLGHIYEGLDDIELEDVVWCREVESSRDHFRCFIAAAI